MNLSKFAIHPRVPTARARCCLSSYLPITKKRTCRRHPWVYSDLENVYILFGFFISDMTNILYIDPLANRFISSLYGIISIQRSSDARNPATRLNL